MEFEEFRQHAHAFVDWMTEYLREVDRYPVLSQIDPGDVFSKLPPSPPQNREEFDDIFRDFIDIIIPGVTHWQHPGFYAYFPANGSPPSILAEMLVATLGVQGMLWKTSPSATELEELVLNWLRDMIGLPSHFTGSIQDTASSSTLCALIAARELKSGYQVGSQGLYNLPVFTTYCSTETHSSIEKGVRIAGLGTDYLRKIPCDDTFAMEPSALLDAIRSDIEAGFVPLCVIATLGTTSSTAIDPLDEIGKICKEYDIWLHVDAALAGSALILPELQWMLKGINFVDSFVFNPAKWLLVNFDCSAFYVRDAEEYKRAFSLTPAYLETDEQARVTDYKDWGIPLGRRFRSLKVWFVIRSYGVTGLQEIIRKHLEFTKTFASRLSSNPNIEILNPINLSTVCFRYIPKERKDEEYIEQVNKALLDRINNSGEFFLISTKLGGKYCLRINIGQVYTEERHVLSCAELLEKEITRIEA